MPWLALILRSLPLMLRSLRNLRSIPAPAPAHGHAAKPAKPEKHPTPAHGHAAKPAKPAKPEKHPAHGHAAKPAKPAKPEKHPAHGHAAKPALVSGSGIFKDIKAPKTAWDNIASACQTGKKRGLESRAAPAGFIPVKMNKFDKYPDSIPVGLYTEGLITCFGIAIHGVASDQKPKANTRWLLHMVASSSSEWEEFEKAVKAEKLENMQGYMSLPKPAKIGAKVGPLIWSQADQDLATEIIEKMKTAVKTLTGKEPKFEMREMEPPTSMQIDGKGVVVAAGKTL
ncbi:hypothetical protein G7Y89_g15542 [Cudoniella acicularis]|uniref:Uncharacterized protein n=1 Tax=Cudoniella acicularis TaxID=354080 RepID=A0A8H4QM56_9HELO|nr:hypothetical protein G7Y89_g15542 [Cudoniella acicularis]